MIQGSIVRGQGAVQKKFKNTNCKLQAPNILFNSMLY